MSLLDITILYFAQTYEITGCKIEKTEIQKNTKVGDLFNQILTKYPKLKELETKIQIAVNKKIVKKNFVIKEDSEIALLPPIAGG